MTRVSPILRVILSTAAVLGLVACSSTGEPREGYAAATERLAADCQTRGGILIPTSGQTGRAETDNVCKITGGASRLTSGT